MYFPRSHDRVGEDRIETEISLLSDHRQNGDVATGGIGNLAR